LEGGYIYGNFKMTNNSLRTKVTAKVYGELSSALNWTTSTLADMA